MKNKYLIYLGVMGACTPLSMLLWIWWVIDMEALSSLMSETSKFFLLFGGSFISLFFAGMTVYFLNKSKAHCAHCGAEMEQQIMQADKLATVGQLAGGVAHEVNTPASIISGRVEAMLLEPDPLSKQVQEDLNVIKKQADRISQITRNLLLFSKRNPAEKSATDLNEIVKESLSLIGDQLKKSKIETSIDLSSQPIIVWGQHNQLVQVLLNLLTNARDALQNKKGKIEIQTKLSLGSHPRAVLTVKDSGIGISKENLTLIFDPFYTTKSTGTGLGLSVSYGIIQEHGGTIHVKSEPGEGTTFAVYLPLKK